jgi:hypothetical protein
MTILPAIPPTVPDEVQFEFPATCRLLVLRLKTTGDLPISALRAGSLTVTSLRRDFKASLPSAAPQLLSELANSGKDKLAKVMSRGLSRYLMRKNQYLPMPKEWDGTAKHLYAEFLDGFAAAAGEVHKASLSLVAHQRRLRALLNARDAEGARNDEPICASYSPKLQLRLLHLDPNRLIGPIIDIGCGEHGRLVRYLRSLGRADVLGIDALCETAGPLIRGSWLEKLPAPGSFGTIIAHQSISLHLLRHHLRGNHGNAEQLVRAFFGILTSLTPGGAFYYAPAIPFLEELLPTSRWSVQRWPVTVSALPAVFEATRRTALPARHSL